MSTELPVKKCNGCGETKSAPEFHKAAKGKYGIRGTCKKCIAAYSALTFEKRAKKSREYYQANRETRRQWHKEHRRRIREEVLKHYGYQCECCGERRHEFLAVDHQNGGGSKHRKIIGTSMYQWLKREGFPAGYRLLCHNCNCAIGFYGYCPHTQSPTTQSPAAMTVSSVGTPPLGLVANSAVSELVASKK